jgi:hypothetical protein
MRTGFQRFPCDLKVGIRHPGGISRVVRVIIGSLCVTLLGACAVPRPSAPIDVGALDAERHRMAAIALASWSQEAARVFEVSYRLSVTAHDQGLCEHSRLERGALLLGLDQLPDSLADEVRHAGLLDHRLIVAAVAVGSSAAIAGLHAGDLVSDGTGLPGSSNDRVPVGSVGSMPVCDVDVVMDPSHDLYAQANVFGTIHVSQGMVQALHDDDSLAFVIGHELGHLVRGDTAAYRWMDAPASRDQERQADLFGIQLAASAGFNVGNVRDVWDRLARIDPDHVGQNLLRDHPLRAERNLRLQQALTALVISAPAPAASDPAAARH